VERPPLLRCKAPDPSLSCLCPLMGSQHPSDGLFSPMEVRTAHLPMCTGPNGTCPSGMILHINSYALHGLINHRVHSNVTHISSSILLNTCIKSLIHQSKLKDITQACNTHLEKMTGRPIGLVSTGKGKFSEETSSKPCKWVMWSRDVQARGCNEGRGCKALPVGAFVEGKLHLSWMQIFPIPCLYSFLLFFYFLYCFFLQETNQGTLPWRGDQW
jgi:hypothetical protein